MVALPVLLLAVGESGLLSKQQSFERKKHGSSYCTGNLILDFYNQPNVSSKEISK
jgi:hypothetical protein